MFCRKKRCVIANLSFQDIGISMHMSTFLFFIFSKNTWKKQLDLVTKIMFKCAWIETVQANDTFFDMKYFR